MTGPGWFPDPAGRHEFRYWDGARWAEHVSDGGVQSVDPEIAAPAAHITTPAADSSEEDPDRVAPAPVQAGALVTLMSHDQGKNAYVYVFPDRIERVLSRWAGKGKRATEMVSMRTITGVRTEKDGFRWSKVLVDSAGTAVSFRMRHEDAQKMRATITKLLLEHHAEPAQVVMREPPVPAVSVADELVKLASLRDAGVLSPAEFEVQKARLLTGG